MLARLFKRAAVPNSPPQQWAPTWGSSDWSGSFVTADTALGVPALGRAVDLLAGTIAGLPIDVYRGNMTGPDSPVRVPPDEVAPILFDPSPPLTPWTYRYGVLNDLILWGNHISYVVSRGDDGWPEALLPLPVTDVSVRQENLGGPFIYQVYGYELTPDEVWHVTSGNVSGRIGGRGVVQQYAQSVGTVQAAEEFAGRYYSTGSLPTGVISHADPNLGHAQAQAVKAAFVAAVGNRKREPVVLPAGSGYTPIIQDIEKAQLSEARSWNANLIATIFGIPPFLLGLKQEGLVYSNSEMLARVFTTFTLTRWTRLIEQSMDRHLLPLDLHPVFNFDSLVTPDMATLTNVLAQQVAAGLRTRNEARVVLNLQPVEGGDVIEAEQPAPQQEGETDAAAA